MIARGWQGQATVQNAEAYRRHFARRSLLAPDGVEQSVRIVERRTPV